MTTYKETYHESLARSKAKQADKFEKTMIKKIARAMAKTPLSSDVIIIRVGLQAELSWLLGHDWELITSTMPQVSGTAGLPRYILKRNRAWVKYQIDLDAWQRSQVK